MHGEELRYMTEAYETNWMSTLGRNIDEIEKTAKEKLEVGYPLALATGTAALHLCMRLAGIGRGVKVACSDVTFDATVNPVQYEGGEQIFIDTERETWNMDPEALKKAFELYPDIKAVVAADLYGVPGKLDEIKAVCDEHGAVLIEDAAESLGAYYKGKPCGSFGKYNAISFNGNKIITGSAGGMLLTDDEQAVLRAKKWSTQARDDAPWYQHSELGYNYRMSNVVAGVVRGQFPHLEEHIAQKKAIYERYKEGFKGLPVSMNPFDADNSEPNYWLSCMIIDNDAMCRQERSDLKASFIPEHGKSCPTEILEALAGINAEGRPIWKPMHMQPIYKDRAFVSVSGDVGADIFERALCLPSDNKMTAAEQDIVIEVIRRCFD